MKHVLFALLMLLLGAPAQAAWPCIPKEFAGTGGYFTLASTPDADSLGWTCVVNGTAAIYSLTVIRGYVPGAGCVASAPSAMAAIVTSPTPLATANAMMDRCEDVPPLGSSARAKYDGARNLMLSLVRAKWATDHPPTGDVYRTPAAGSFTVYTVVNGKLGSVVAGKKAPAAATCDCAALRVMSGTSSYCPFPGAAPAEVTYCVKAAP